MAEQHRQPVEETSEVAAAVADDTTAPQFRSGGGPDDMTPQFRAPTAAPGAAHPPSYRTGAEQPWEPRDLAIAQGRDPTPENIERARRELANDGAAAIERTVP